MFISSKDETRARIHFFQKAIRHGHVITMKEQCGMGPLDAVASQAALILEGKRPILTRRQSKLDKAQGKDTGYVNRGLTLATSREALPFLGLDRRYDTCAGATDACRAACVGSRTGQGRLPSSGIARVGRYLALIFDTARFYELLDREIATEERRATRKGFKLAMRCNVASDLGPLAARCAAGHPGVTFYDYTAIPSSVRTNDGVRRVYSLKDGARRLDIAQGMIDSGYGVAVVFAASARNGDPLPATWHGAPVIDGDLHDLWFLQAPASGPFVVGLRVKGDTAQVNAARAAGFAVAC